MPVSGPATSRRYSAASREGGATYTAIGCFLAFLPIFLSSAVSEEVDNSLLRSLTVAVVFPKSPLPGAGMAVILL